MYSGVNLNKRLCSKVGVIDELRNRTGFRKADIEEIYNALLDIIEDSISKGETMKLGFIEVGGKTATDRRCYDPVRKKIFIKSSHYLPYARINSSYVRKHMIEVKEQEAQNI